MFVQQKEESPAVDYADINIDWSDWLHKIIIVIILHN